MPEFFIPGLDPEQAEAQWREMHDRSPIPVTDQRVYRADCVHDGDDITATVGRCREHTRHYRKRSGRIDDSRRPRRFTTGNVVLAIFEGAVSSQSQPTLVIWEQGPPSSWANPSMCGSGADVVYFDAPS